MIILNLKNYAESTGANLVSLIKSVDEALESDARLKDVVVVAPAIYDLHYAKTIASNVKICAPHADAKGIGSTTGWAPAASLVALGIDHSVLNHSEHRFADWGELEKTIVELQNAGLKLTICCENLAEAEKLLALKPYAIAYEDKDLIGSGQSITTGRPDEVKAFINLVKGKSKAIIGAGISSAEDVAQGKAFGAEGFILASAFVKAQDRKAKVLELAQAFLD